MFTTNIFLLSPLSSHAFLPHPPSIFHSELANNWKRSRYIDSKGCYEEKSSLEEGFAQFGGDLNNFLIKLLLQLHISQFGWEKKKLVSGTAL